jgi:hypothetical protein
MIVESYNPLKHVIPPYEKMLIDLGLFEGMHWRDPDVWCNRCDHLAVISGKEVDGYDVYKCTKCKHMAWCDGDEWHDYDPKEWEKEDEED